MSEHPKRPRKHTGKARPGHAGKNQPSPKRTNQSKQLLSNEEQPTGKGSVQPKTLHPRNLHLNGYDFEALVSCSPELADYVRPNPFGNLSIDFANAQAVKILNSALLKYHYQINYWDIPDGFLCPPIPGRVDYIHYLADLLTTTGKGTPKGSKVVALDVGTGANGVYPLLGKACYGWRFVASDIDPLSIANVERLKVLNSIDDKQLTLRLQQDTKQVFRGIIKANERYDLTLCNPPFHRSLDEAAAGTAKKLANLDANRKKKGLLANKPHSKAQTILNFGGQKAELWCEGGEAQFLRTMVLESAEFSSQCLWFTSLVSKQENLKPCHEWLQQVAAKEVRVIDMAQGNKLTRVIAWTFLTESQRQTWAKFRV